MPYHGSLPLQTLLRAVARLPLPLLHLAGGLLGWILYLASPTYRRHLRQNLVQAGFADGATRRAAIASAGKMLLELPGVWLRTREELNAWVRGIDGEALIDEARAAGRGVVFITPHLGCFEILAQVAGERFPITVLYRPPKLAFLQPMIEEGRAGRNVKLAPTDLSGVRQLVAALRAGEAVGMLPDQVPGEGEGEWADFFGRPAYTMTLATKLASRPETETLLAYGERLAGGRGFVVRLRRMPPAEPGETPTRRLNRAIESLVRENPGQYLWGYNRYKTPRAAAARGKAPPG